LPACDIIVLGGSAGALPVLRGIAAALPGDLAAAVFVVMHLAPDYDSNLDQILDRSGPLKALTPADRAPIQRGRIYVAPPDRHLTLEDGVVRVRRGPRENRH
jgi:two-component system chemotaxis response regulator CheB